MLSPCPWLPGGRLLAIVLISLIAQAPVNAIQLVITDTNSIAQAASHTLYGTMGWYGGNETGGNPGAFPTKWWEGAALFHSALQYWYATGDTTYNDETVQAMQHQAGENGDYMPSNYSSYLGNDDQMFWGLAAMCAAEWKFQEDPNGFSWLSLAQGVFNTQVARWDDTTCGGGLRWQIFPYQAGYTIKNSISNGGFFQMAARLAHYTHNVSYADWAEKAWDWSVSSPLVNNVTWNIGDTTGINNNCADLGNNQWTYNYGSYLAGAAYMYAYTNGTVPKWKEAVQGILGKALKEFFPAKFGGNAMSEILCEPRELCNDNEILFKGYLASWLALTGLLVPEVKNLITPKLEGSAQSLANACTGMGNDTCGVRWWGGQWDGWNGMEEGISATCGFTSVLVLDKGQVPLTSFTGGNSTSDPGAGSGADDDRIQRMKPITSGDKTGAGIATALFVVGWVSLMVWMLLGS